MRTLRGMLIRTLALACVIAGSNVEAQNAGAPSRSVSSNLPQFNPQPLYIAQAPVSAGQSFLNQPMVQQQPMMYSPYGVIPATGVTGYPATYGDPQQGPMGGPMMSGPMMGGPMMGEPMAGDSYSMQDGSGMGGYGPSGEGGFCPHCGGAGCDHCSAHHDGILAGFLRRLLPYAEGGACAPRWYDIAVDGLYWTRDEVSDFVPFTVFTRQGETVLSSDDLAYDNQPGGRLSANLQLLPGVALDFSYIGLFSWSANASVTSPVNELFSPFSNFGELVGVGLPFDESDQAQFHSLRSSSTIDSFELSVRKYWTGPNCRLQGSYRSGVRYVYLVDDLNFFTLGRSVPVGLGTAPAGQSSTDVRTHNSLVGWQGGFDLWANIVPGVSVGSDIRAGIYGNHAKYNTRVFGTTTTGGTSADLFETNTNADIAVVAEANILFIYRVNPNLTLRAGYSGMFIDGLALAPENFNPSNPFNTTRTIQAVDTDGDAFFHGGFGGFEWMW